MLLKSKKKINQIQNKKKYYFEILKIVKEALNILENKKIDLIGNLLDKYWKIKKISQIM